LACGTEAVLDAEDLGLAAEEEAVAALEEVAEDTLLCWAGSSTLQPEKRQASITAAHRSAEIFCFMKVLLTLRKWFSGFFQKECCT